MLEKLFGSKHRVKIIRLFITGPEKVVGEEEVAKKLNMKIAMVRPILKDLYDVGFLRQTRRQAGKMQLTTNTLSYLYPELKALFLKSDILLERDLVPRLERLGSVFYLALTGKLAGVPSVPIDMLIVGRVNRRKLNRLVKSFEKELGQEIQYAIMSRREFDFRRSLTDRFLFSILEGRKIVAVNRLKI